MQVAEHVLRAHLYRQPGETAEVPPVEPGIMDLLAEAKMAGDVKQDGAAPVWLRGGGLTRCALGGGGAGAAGGDEGAWPEDSLVDNQVKDLDDIQVRSGDDG